MGTDSFSTSSIPRCHSPPHGRYLICSLANLPNPGVLSPTYILIKSQRSSLVMNLGRPGKGVPSHGKGVPSHGVVLGNRRGRGSYFWCSMKQLGKTG